MSRPNIIGVVVEKTSPDRVVFLAKKPTRVGEYVTVNIDRDIVVYMVEQSEIESKLLSTVRDYITAEEAKKAAELNPRDRTYRCMAKALGVFNDGWKPVVPSIPPDPGSYVYEADDSMLSMIYRVNGYEWVEVGHLLRRPSVPVSININKVCSRHLAILATTGKGKSNLLALLAKRIAEKNGTMIIFDYHAEYANLRSPFINYVTPRINPRNLDAEDLADLLDIRRSADKQRSILRRAFLAARDKEDFWQALRNELNNLAEQDQKDQQAALRVLEIVDRSLATKGKLFDEKSKTLLDTVRKNRVNIVDLSEFTERQAQIIVQRFLLEILNDRKNAVFGLNARLNSPIVIALEEAHVFIPSHRDESECAETVARVAREGRKFGVGLIIVSQRPNRLDADVVSQMGSFAISGLSHPEDQSFVVKATDAVSEELGITLPCLNTGEMILAGQWVKTTALAKISLVEEKLIGKDLDAVKQWEEDKLGEEMFTDPEDLIKP